MVHVEQHELPVEELCLDGLQLGDSTDGRVLLLSLAGISSQLVDVAESRKKLRLWHDRDRLLVQLDRLVLSILPSTDLGQRSEREV